MDLQMDDRIAGRYHSNSQKVRIITENWVGMNAFCPYCGNKPIKHFENNRPVADFYCPHCFEEYELKSKHTSIKCKVAGGAYGTMIERISAVNNPNFFLMRYGKDDLRVKDFVMIPKHFFVPEIIEKRKPLADTAKRAGWIGCNIILNQIPDEGRIYIVKDEVEQPVDSILQKVKKTEFIRQYKPEEMGWIFDILSCLNRIADKEFTLAQMYQFEYMLAEKHPNNYHVREKIRQQLQVLRDRGIIEFKGRGYYKKI